MLTRTTTIFAAAVLAMGLGTGAANADWCSGRNHTAATVGGAVGGGLIGGLATHSAVGAVIGAGAGALIGNAVAREGDCYRGRGWYHRGGYYHHRRHRHGRYYYYN